MNFWHQLQKPIIGLSPMDGVTDAPFRYVTAKHGRPDVMFTEFVPVEAITHNAVKVMADFLYSEIERPVVAQIYGAEPESFYKVAHVVCELGFDGIDINMGCPAKSVVHGGCGAGLIRTPDRAKAIIRATQQAVKDWSEGSTMERVGIPKDIIKWVRAFQNCVATGPAAEAPHPSASPSATTETAYSQGLACWQGWGPRSTSPVRNTIPVTVKTRIGYSENTITDWVKHLLETEPVVISIHGRTLKQMYKGEADWDAIAAAAEIIHQTPTLVLGNGDIKSAADAAQKIRTSGVDGVLIGRAAYGNPWLFTQAEAIRRAVVEGQLPERRWVEPKESLDVMLEHARLFGEMRSNLKYVAMRKHFGWYAQWIPELRVRKKELMQINSYQELETLVGRHSREGGNPEIGSPLAFSPDRATGRG